MVTQPKLVLALPDYETRQIVIASDEMIDDERVVCVAIKEAIPPLPKKRSPYIFGVKPSTWDAQITAAQPARDIKTWQERIKTDNRTYAIELHMKAEIADLRAALAFNSTQPVSALTDAQPLRSTKSTGADNVQPALRPVPMGLFPHMATLQSVVDLANSQLPINTPNAVLGLLMCYHNTLLKVLQDEQKTA